MRLYEFDHEPPIKTELKKYIRAGYKRIGEPSASAAVFASPDGKEVIKVGKTSDCWLKYAKAVAKVSNPHTPVISNMKEMDGFYLANMEFLRELPETFFKTDLYQKIAAWLHVVGGWANGKDVFLHKKSEVEIQRLASDLAKEQPDIVDALKIIVRTRGGCNYDCYPENMMQRSNKTLVFSDPLTHQG